MEDWLVKKLVEQVTKLKAEAHKALAEAKAAAERHGLEKYFQALDKSVCIYKKSVEEIPKSLSAIKEIWRNKQNGYLYLKLPQPFLKAEAYISKFDETHGDKPYDTTSKIIEIKGVPVCELVIDSPIYGKLPGYCVVEMPQDTKNMQEVNNAVKKAFKLAKVHAIKQRKEYRFLDFLDDDDVGAGSAETGPDAAGQNDPGQPGEPGDKPDKPGEPGKPRTVRVIGPPEQVGRGPAVKCQSVDLATGETLYLYYSRVEDAPAVSAELTVTGQVAVKGGKTYLKVS